MKKIISKVSAFLDKWGKLIIGFLLLLVAFLVIRSFSRTKVETGDADYKKQTELYRQLLYSKQAEIDALKKENKTRDSIIEYNQRADSLLKVRIDNNNKIILNEIQKNRAALGARIDRLSGKELGEYFSNLP